MHKYSTVSLTNLNIPERNSVINTTGNEQATDFTRKTEVYVNDSSDVRDKLLLVLTSDSISVSIKGKMNSI